MTKTPTIRETDRLRQLTDQGVAIWLDDLSRDRLETGALQALVDTCYVVGVTSNPIVVAAGTSWRNSSRRFIPNEPEKNTTPVTLPPGRLRLATKPAATGSPPIAKRIGTVGVATLAARGATSPPLATNTTTCRPIKSATRNGNRPG